MHEQDALDKLAIASAPTVQEQPRLEISDWAILESGCGDQYLMGLHTYQSRLRLTTPIASFQAAGRLIQTKSGRIYELLGPPTQDPTVLLVMAVHAIRVGLSMTGDVSSEFWKTIQHAAQ